MFFDHLFYHQKIIPQTLDEHWMYIAIQNAIKGYGFTKPNPLVGAVIIDENNLIAATGYHAYWGGEHAEVIAINNLPPHFNYSKATLYCTLEPCCHTQKKTPPCLPLILEKKFKRVVIGSLDPNSEVNGHSIKILKERGFEVSVGVLEKSIHYLNREFFNYQKNHRPYLHLKMALSLDGSFGPITHEKKTQKWMTNKLAKEYVHFLRAGVEGILIGGNTYRSDTPQLTCRLTEFCDEKNFRQPKKILISRDNQLNPEATVKIENIELLLQLNIQNILMEAGPELQSHFLEKNNFDELSIILTPLILGNKQKLNFDNNYGLNDALTLSNGKWITLNDNILFHWVKNF